MADAAVKITELVELTNPSSADVAPIVDVTTGITRKVRYSTISMAYVVDFSEADQGLAGNGNSVKDIVDAIGATKSATLVFPHYDTGDTTTYTFATSETIPANFRVVVEDGALLQLDNGVTLTINGPFEAGLYQAFTWTGTGKVDFSPGARKEVYPQWWGAVGDGTTDDKAAIQAAVDSIPTGATYSGGGVVFFPVPSKSYFIASTVVVPAYISLIGAAPHVQIKPSAIGSFSNNYCFYLNTVDGSTWVSTYDGSRIGVVENLFINNVGGAVTTKGFFAAGSYEFDRIAGRTLANLITTSTDYIDSLKLSRIQTRDPQGTTYQIKINQLGDNLNINTIQFSDGGYGLAIIGCWGGVVKNVIGGTNHLFRDNRALTLRNWHCEGTYIDIETSSMHLEDMILGAYSDVAIKFTATGDERHFVSLSNVLFDYRLDEGLTGDGQYDIKTADRFHITLDNVFKLTGVLGAIDKSSLQGVLLQKEDDTEFYDFNKDSAFLSKHCEILFGQRLNFHYVTQGGSGTPATTIATNGYVTWQGATDTFYYRGQLLYDVDRMLGINMAEVNIALTNGGDGVLHKLTPASYVGNTLLRLYRGTATGSYNEYVDIPIIIARELYDDGNNVNGIEWQNRTAGGLDARQDPYGTKKTAIDFECIHTAAPTQGAWTLGDRIWDNIPTGGAAPGWICITSGTFGAATDNTGDTDGSTAVITGMTDTSDFPVGSYVMTSAGFPSSVDDGNTPVKILSKTATTITIDDTSDSIEANITVDTSDPVFKAMANLAA